MYTEVKIRVNSLSNADDNELSFQEVTTNSEESRDQKKITER